MCGYWPFASFRCYATFVGYQRQGGLDPWSEGCCHEITRGRLQKISMLPVGFSHPRGGGLPAYLSPSMAAG